MADEVVFFKEIKAFACDSCGHAYKSHVRHCPKCGNYTKQRILDEEKK